MTATEALEAAQRLGVTDRGEDKRRKLQARKDVRLNSIGVRSQRDAIRGDFSVTVLQGDSLEIMVPGSDNAALYYLSVSPTGVLQISTGASVRVARRELSECIVVAPKSRNMIEVSRVPHAKVK